MTVAADSPPWRTTGGGVLLRVRVTPKAAKDAIEACEPTAEGLALKARVRAVPEDGAANAAVERLVATWLGVPKRAVAVTHGHKSRVKTLTLSGPSDSLTKKLAALLAGLET